MQPRNLLSSLRFWEDDGFQRNRKSVIALVASNFLPLVGVALLGWRVVDIVFLYWIENLIVGVFNVLKIITCVPGKITEEDIARNPLFSADQRTATLKQINETDGKVPFHALKLFIVPFFVFHYGMFCGVHGVFLSLMLSEGGPFGGPQVGASVSLADLLMRPWYAVAVLGLIASHAISYFVNFIGQGECQRTHPILLMFMPYGRIIVLHIAIIFSAFLSLLVGSPIWLLLLVVIGKTWIDLAMHLVEHRGDTESKQV